MDVDRQVAILQDSLARQLGWIAAADTKAGFVFAIATAMLGLLASAAPEYGKWTTAGVTFSFVATILLLGSLAAIVFTIFPRTAGPKLSVIFFGSIASRGIDEYRNDIHQLDDAIYAEDLIQQVYVNAEIASAKYRCVKIASVLLALGVLPWVSAAYVLFRDK
jgi:hypothetical protein